MSIESEIARLHERYKLREVSPMADWINRLAEAI
jgi:hypothetical protein